MSEIQNLLSIVKNINLELFTYNNQEYYQKISKILLFFKNLEQYFDDIIEKLNNSNIRFCDYYDEEYLHKEQIVNYFLENYGGSDKLEIVDCFCLYALIKKVENIFYNIEGFNLIDELCEILDDDYYFEDIFYLIDRFDMLKNKKNNYEGLPFMNPEKKYKIMFYGYAFDDIKKLEKNTIKSLIKKLDSQLSSNDIITLSESVDHVKDKYSINISRVQFADDYRITYYRKYGVTVILGVSLKTGKPIDYTRYDAIAVKQKEMEQEIIAFNSDALLCDSIHNKTIEFLESFYEKEMKKKII